MVTILAATFQKLSSPTPSCTTRHRPWTHPGTVMNTDDYPLIIPLNANDDAAASLSLLATPTEIYSAYRNFGEYTIIGEANACMAHSGLVSIRWKSLSLQKSPLLTFNSNGLRRIFSVAAAAISSIGTPRGFPAPHM